MFEKEAEEWANEMYPCDGQAQRYLLMGAEFGYNKSKEDVKDIIVRLIANHPDTYSGTDIEFNQKRMFKFSKAVSDAQDYFKGVL